MSSNEEINPGDYVAVNHGYDRREGVVLESYADYNGRQMLVIQLEPGDLHHAWYPTVTRVRRTVNYARPSVTKRTIERRVYW